MKRIAVFALLLALGSLLAAPTARSQLMYRQAFQEKHGLNKGASCYTCHARGKDGNGGLLGKEHRNIFGEQIDRFRVIRNPRQALERAKAAGPAAEAAMRVRLVDDFRQALDRAELRMSPQGPTWGQIIERRKAANSNLADYLRDHDLSGPAK